MSQNDPNRFFAPPQGQDSTNRYILPANPPPFRITYDAGDLDSGDVVATKPGSRYDLSGIDIGNLIRRPGPASYGPPPKGPPPQGPLPSGSSKSIVGNLYGGDGNSDGGGDDDDDDYAYDYVGPDPDPSVGTVASPRAWERKRDPTRRGPRDYREMYRALNWRFRRFRRGMMRAGDETIAQNRTEWMGAIYPKHGPVEYDDGFVPTFYRSPAMKGLAYEMAGNIQRRLDEAKEWFVDKKPFEYVKPLGHGGLGLTMLFKWKSNQPQVSDRDVVLKVGLHSWSADDIRFEARATKKMRRAAHCIQSYDPEEFGMAAPTPYRFEPVSQLDSSAGEETDDSSGEEDRPNRRPRREPTRRWFMENATRTVRRKARRHVNRIADAQRRESERAHYTIRAEMLRERNEELDFNPDDWDVDRKDYLLLEFMELGDLQNTICKLNDLGETVPNRVLWSFWLCLVRACVAMEYPPRKFHPGRRPRTDVSAANQDVETDAGPIDLEDLSDTDGSETVRNTGRPKVWGRAGNDLLEEVPNNNRKWHNKNMVHFDIDPRNIFICIRDPDVAQGEHFIVPRLKIADFGLAEEVKPNKSNQYYTALRHLAKHGYYAPEQFGADWEYVNPPPDTALGPELSESRIPGRYSQATNVWGIALTMWQIITRSNVPSAPQPAVDRSGLTHYCPLLLTQRYNDVDEQLRVTIARCMRHHPSHRPRLRALLREAKEGVTRQYAGETDEFIRDWVKRVFFEPVQWATRPIVTPPAPPVSSL